jgi:hypothetical protein
LDQHRLVPHARAKALRLPRAGRAPPADHHQPLPEREFSRVLRSQVRPRPRLGVLLLDCCPAYRPPTDLTASARTLAMATSRPWRRRHLATLTIEPLQPYHVEVWAEKTTMNDILVPLCSSLGTNYVSGAGYQSITFGHKSPVATVPRRRHE